MSVKPYNADIVLLESDDDDREQSPHSSKIQRTGSGNITNLHNQQQDIHNNNIDNGDNNNNNIKDSTLIHSTSTINNNSPQTTTGIPSVESSAKVSTTSIKNDKSVNTDFKFSPSPNASSLSNGGSDLEEVSLGESHVSESPSSASNTSFHPDDDEDDSVDEDEDEEGVISKESTSMARFYLKLNGSMKFLDKYLPVTLSSDDLLRLIRLLGYKPKIFNIESEEEKLMFLIKYLQRAMNKVLIMRVRLQNFNKIDNFIQKLQTCNKIMVLTGAGISTSLGIPDFRSSKGFYARLQHLGLDDPQEVFDLNYFKQDPSIFYSIAHLIVPPENAFTPLHGFIKLLQDKGKLLRNYTQNIDNLESNVGILKENLIQCHGSFATLSCVTCGFQVPGDTIFPEIKLQSLPICPWCKLKRDKIEDEEMQGSYGVMKPDITFFGELLPERFHHTIKNDIQECDLLICIGTSLKVAPVSNIVNLIPDTVPQILINKDLVNHCEFDLSLLGYCDTVISYICMKLGWQIDHQDFNKIVSQDLQCHDVKPEIGIYNIFNYDKDQLQKDENSIPISTNDSSNNASTTTTTTATTTATNAQPN